MEGKLLELDGRRLVISPHKNDSCDFFKSSFNKILNYLTTNKSIEYYNISIEHPDTNKHMDITFFIAKGSRVDNTQRSINKILDKFEEEHVNTKTHETKTTTKGFRQWQVIKKEIRDIKKAIGYGMKEDPVENWNNFPAEFLIECKEYYFANTEKKKEEEFPVIAPRAGDLLSCLLSYKHKHSNVPIEMLYKHMVEYGNYSFLNLSDKVQKKALIELKIRLQKNLHEYEKRDFNYLNGLETNLTGMSGYETIYSIRTILENETLSKQPEKQLMELKKFLSI